MAGLPAFMDTTICCCPEAALLLLWPSAVGACRCPAVPGLAGTALQSITKMASDTHEQESVMFGRGGLLQALAAAI